MAPRDRSMLVFVSDIHLTDVLNNASIPRVDTFERFWTRIKTARGDRPAHLCFVGDLFDIVRSPSWLQSDVRPYDDPSAEVIARVDSIVDAVLVREALFFKAIRDHVTSGELSVHYVLGNHDRLLRFAKKTRRLLQHRHVAQRSSDRTRHRRPTDVFALRRHELLGFFSERRRARARLRMVDRKHGSRSPISRKNKPIRDRNRRYHRAMTTSEAFTIASTSDALENLTLIGPNSRLVLAPKRGGMATRLTLQNRELFYLDEETLRDETKNVRGGNPVLFPSPGKLENDAYAWKETRGTLKQHGFARNSAWEVLRTSTKEGGASATLRLTSNERTHREFPWNFNAEYTYSLSASSLRIDLSFTNTGAGELPFGAGFHPYFHVPQSEKAHARVETNATRAFDNVSKKTEPLAPIDLTEKEVDLHLIDHHGDCVLGLQNGGVRLKGSPEFSRWVVWTLAGKDFVCVEPWTCPGNALNTGESILLLEPQQTRALWVEYSVV